MDVRYDVMLDDDDVVGVEAVGSTREEADFCSCCCCVCVDDRPRSTSTSCPSSYNSKTKMRLNNNPAAVLQQYIYTLYV